MAKKSSKRSPKGNLATELKNLQKNWKKSKPRKSGSSIPDGDYGVRIESAIIAEARTSGRMQVVWTLQVISPKDFEGRSVLKFSGMETEDNLDFLQGDLEVLELSIPDKISDLGATLEEAAGLLVDINVYTKDEFTNINFLELLEDDDTDDDEEEDEEDEDEDEDDDEEEEEEEDEDEEEEEEDDDDEDAEEEDEDELTEEAVNNMNKAKLTKAIKEYGIKINTKKYKTIAALRKAVIAKM